MKNADSGRGGFPSDALGLVKAPADDAQPELMIKNTVNRRVRHVVETAQGDIGIVGYAGRVPQQENKKNIRVRRQGLRSFQHLIEGKVVPVDEVDPGGISLR